jgi:hypothetical protein
MGKLGRLGLEPAVRYERERPGELIHIDVKKLGRIIRQYGLLVCPVWGVEEAGSPTLFVGDVHAVRL